MTLGSTQTPSSDAHMRFLCGAANGSTLQGTNHSAKLFRWQENNMYLCSAKQNKKTKNRKDNEEQQQQRKDRDEQHKKGQPEDDAEG